MEIVIQLYAIQQYELDHSKKNWIYQFSMGTGKSFTALAHYEKWAKGKDLVILGPKSVVMTKQWIKTINNYFDIPINYEIYKHDEIKKLPQNAFEDKYIIIDEAHKYKSIKSQRSIALRQLIMKSDGFCLLSGTLANGDLVKDTSKKAYLLKGAKWEDMINYYTIFEYWNMFHNKSSSIPILGKKKLIGEYITHSPVKQGWVGMRILKLDGRSYRLGASAFELWKYRDYHKILSKWFYSVTSNRVLLQDVAELPDVTNNVVTFKPHKDYNKSKSSYKKMDKIIFEQDVERRVWQRQNQNTKAKCDWLKEFLESNQENTIIFYNFNSELEVIKKIAKKSRENVYEINGKRHHQIPKDAKNSLILVQIMAGGAGLELQLASYAIWWSLPDSYTNYKQSLYRNYRVGQNKKVSRYELLVSGTIDDSIKKSLEQKKDFKSKEYED